MHTVLRDNVPITKYHSVGMLSNAWMSSIIIQSYSNAKLLIRLHGVDAYSTKYKKNILYDRRANRIPLYCMHANSRLAEELKTFRMKGKKEKNVQCIE